MANLPSLIQHFQCPQFKFEIEKKDDRHDMHNSWIVKENWKNEMKTKAKPKKRLK